MGGIASFATPVGSLTSRIDPAFVRLDHQFRELASRSKYPLVPLGDVLERIDYGLSERSEATANGGVPILRMNNVKDCALDITDVKYADSPPSDKVLTTGDLLINRTNSKELVGKVAVFDQPGEWTFASYLLRGRVTKEVDSSFVALFLSTTAGRLQIDRDSRQIIGMANVNTTEVRGWRVPMPPLDVQRRLADRCLAVRATALQQVRAAEQEYGDALAAIEALFDADETSGRRRTTVAVRLEDLLGSRFDPGPWMHASAKRTTRHLPLRDALRINPRRARPPADDLGNVPYVGLPDCTMTRVRALSSKPARSAPAGRAALRGDILFARIEPSVFNKKYVLATETVPVTGASVSGEFHILEVRQAVADPSFIYATLFTTGVGRQVIGRTTGASGRRRLPETDLGEVAVPLVDRRTQVKLGHRFVVAQDQIDVAKQQAEMRWQEAKAAFVGALFRD